MHIKYKMPLNRIKRFIQAQITRTTRIRLSQLPRCRTVKSVESFIARNIEHLSTNNDLSIDLGSNSNPKNPFSAKKCIGIDISPSLNNDDVLICDLFNEKIPLPDNSVSSVTAFDFIEHIPRVANYNNTTRFPFIETMNEVHRILKPGGLFLSFTPAYPFKEAFQDPTHVNIITEDTFPFYFSINTSSNEQGLAKIYGFSGQFYIVDQAWQEFRLITLMKKK